MTPLELYRTLVPISSPVLTFYGGAERIDLSGPVLARWLAKTSNFLLQEDFIGPEVTVAIDLPPHWRSIVWAAGCWMAGTKITSWPNGAEDAELLISNHADHLEASSAPVLLAQTMPSLSLAWPGSLPAGASCALSELMAQPDDLLPLPITVGEPRFLNDEEVTCPPLPEDIKRVLIHNCGWEEAAVACWEIWQNKGSVVFTTDPDADLKKLQEIEGTTVTLTGLSQLKHQ